MSENIRSSRRLKHKTETQNGGETSEPQSVDKKRIHLYDDQHLAAVSGNEQLRNILKLSCLQLLVENHKKLESASSAGTRKSERKRLWFKFRLRHFPIYFFPPDYYCLPQYDIFDVHTYCCWGGVVFLTEI